MKCLSFAPHTQCKQATIQYGMSNINSQRDEDTTLEEDGLNVHEKYIAAVCGAGDSSPERRRRAARGLLHRDAWVNLGIDNLHISHIKKMQQPLKTVCKWK